MQLPKQDVVIIGGGVIGLSCALALLEAGRGVTVIERETVGAGASHGNCGTITPSHATPLAEPGMMLKVMRWMVQADAPFYLKPRWDPMLWAWFLKFAARCNPADFWRSAKSKAAILIESRRTLARWIEHHQLDCGFETSGMLYVHRNAKAFEQAHRLHTQLQQLDLPVEIWPATKLRAAEPCLKDDVHGALFHPFDAMLRPDQYLKALAARVRQRGGTIIEHCELLDFVRAGARLTGVRVIERVDARAQGNKTERAQKLAQSKTIHADEFVFALGAWSPLWAKQLDVRLPIQPGKGYSITYTKPSMTPNHPMVLRERSVCVTTWKDGFRLGSTMEFSGYDTTLNRTRLDALVRGAREYLHQPIGESVLEEWFGWRPMTHDDLPIIGRAPACENLMLATGHGMMGMSMSAATGELVAAMINHSALPMDAAPYDPRRFQ